MRNYRLRAYTIDDEAKQLLSLIAKMEAAPGERPNDSQTLRQIIREKAAALGIVAPKPDPKSNKQKAAA